METFPKFLSKICVSTTIHVLRPNLAKIGRCEVTEKSSHIADKKIPGVGDTFEPPISPPLDRAQNFVNVVGLDLCMCTDFGPDRLRFAELIPERVQKGESAMQAFSLQKVKQYRLSAYNYRVRQCVMKGRI